MLDGSLTCCADAVDSCGVCGGTNSTCTQSLELFATWQTPTESSFDNAKAALFQFFSAVFPARFEAALDIQVVHVSMSYEYYHEMNETDVDDLPKFHVHVRLCCLALLSSFAA